MSLSDRYKVELPTGERGIYAIQHYEVSKDDSAFTAIRAIAGSDSRAFVSPGGYTRLTRGGVIVMSDTPSEIREHMDPINQAKRRIRHREPVTALIHGLGIGMIARALLLEGAERVEVVELAQEVIDLVAPALREQLTAGELGDPSTGRLIIRQGNAFDWKPPKGARWTLVWHDIWSNICTDNLPEMTKLHRRFGRRCDWQESWGCGEARRYRDRNRRRGW